MNFKTLECLYDGPNDFKAQSVQCWFIQIGYACADLQALTRNIRFELSTYGAAYRPTVNVFDIDMWHAGLQLLK